MWLELKDLLGPHERFQREGVLIFVDLHFSFLIGIVYLPWCPEKRKWGDLPLKPGWGEFFISAIWGGREAPEVALEIQTLCSGSSFVV